MNLKGENKLIQYHSTTGWYNLQLPENWAVEDEGSLISVYDPNQGVGTLQISAYSIPTDQKLDLVEELTKYLIYRVKIKSKADLISKIKIDSNCAFYEVFKEGNRYSSYWMFYKNYKLIFVTYNCPGEDFSKEKEIIDQILNSLEILS